METVEDIKENFYMPQNDMEAIYKLPHEKNVFLYFDYLKWVNKKIESEKSK
jgi:hypothetical protein